MPRVQTSVKSLSCALLALVAGSSLAAAVPKQGPALPARTPIRIPVRHADPWVVKFMLEGTSVVMPEMSTIFGLFGAPPQSAQGVNGLFSGGHFIVNPTDNSLWWYPD